MVDTSLYPPSYQQKLLTLLSEEYDLDDQTNGVLIHSDNFQALNLLQARYREQVKCIYIDPPYNTNASEILYKNGYKHSSWLSLIANRVNISKSLLNSMGVIEVAIDNQEFRFLNLLLDFEFGEDNFISAIAIEHNAKGIPQKHISATHEYLLLYCKNINDVKTYDFISSDEDIFNKYPYVDDKGRYRELPLMRTGSEPFREDRPYMFFPFLYDGKSISFIKDEEYINIYNSEEGLFRDDYLNSVRKKYETLGYEFILPINSKGEYYRWKWGLDSCKNGVKSNQIIVRDGKVYNKNRVDKSIKPKSLWYDARYDATSKGTRILANIFNKKVFDYPKSLYSVIDAINIGADNNSLILDYFAGSGTTAHAVINLNREDGGKRKYILVEQGEYFDTVLKPRVQKVIYSENWKDGKPMPSEKQLDGFNGVSQIVKVLKLESYEDTLNNIALKPQDDLFKQLPENVQEDYLLRYLLDVESKGSLLNSDDFQHPFDYRLNIATDSAGAYQSTVIDLPETFNYLLGIRVQQITDEREKRGYLTIEGLLPNDARCLIVWRDCEKMGYAEVAQFFDKHNINPNSKQYDVIYLNGDHDMANQWQNEDGSESRLALRAIEPEFLNRMFMEKGE